MYAFLIVVTTLFANGEIKKLYIHSEDQYAEEVCHERADVAAEAAAKRIGSVVRRARIKTEASCDIRPTRVI